jgi:hypothetical protein
VLLSIVLVGGFPFVVRAQPEKADKPKAGENAPANPPADAAVKPDENLAPTPLLETFRDERAKNFLPNTFPQVGKGAPQNVVRQVVAMAAGGPVDRPTIERMVSSCAAALTDHGNIRAVIDLEANIAAGAGAHFAIKQATDDLLEPILVARAANNAGFLTTYNQVLLQTLPPLLQNHLLARIAAMIVLSQTGSVDALELFTGQLANSDQTVWVDLWALRGITKIAQMAGYNLDPSRASKAARVISEFLVREKDLPWPVQYRALEALGALRQASSIPPQKGLPEMASTATQFLTRPDGRLEVRAEAGWALGMMQVQTGITGYNYTLLAHSIGEVAVLLGEQVHEVYPKNPTQAESWTALLITQVLQSLNGVDGARESGLLNANHPSAGAAKAFIKQVSDKTKPIAAAAVRLVKGAPGQSAAALKELEAKVADLKGWLQKNPPPNARLVPAGPAFPVGAAQVANAPGGAAQAAAAPNAGRPQ